MKYFTPELYLLYNSSDDDEANHADEAWEVAIRSYHADLDSIRALMSPRVAELAGAPALHDAELLTLRADFPGSEEAKLSLPMAATISLRQDGQIIHLDYLLWDEVVQAPPLATWPFSPARVHWLYDEVSFEAEASGSGSGSNPTHRFWHRILLSDGRSIAIPFVDVIMDLFSPESPEPALVARASR
jgi:hypothetical protein